jgi:hypothetical protein
VDEPEVDDVDVDEAEVDGVDVDEVEADGVDVDEAEVDGVDVDEAEVDGVDVDEADVVGVDVDAVVDVDEVVGDDEVVGVPDVAGVGGAVMRINAAKLTMSEEKSDAWLPLGLEAVRGVVSSGRGLSRQLADGLFRSSGKPSLVTPCSTS